MSVSGVARAIKAPFGGRDCALKTGRPATMTLVAVDDLSLLLSTACTGQGRLFRRWFNSRTIPRTVLQLSIKTGCRMKFSTSIMALGRQQ